MDDLAICLIMEAAYRSRSHPATPQMGGALARGRRRVPRCPLAQAVPPRRLENKAQKTLRSRNLTLPPRNLTRPPIQGSDVRSDAVYPDDVSTDGSFHGGAEQPDVDASPWLDCHFGSTFRSPLPDADTSAPDGEASKPDAGELGCYFDEASGIPDVRFTFSSSTRTFTLAQARSRISGSFLEIAAE